MSNSKKIVNKSQKINMKSPVSELSAKKTDYDIPTFGFKSALIIVIGGVLGTIVAPYLLSLIGISKSLGVVIGNTFITSFAIAYSRFFIESKIGYCKKFWIIYGMFSASFGIISFFWMYLKVYM